MSFVLTLVAADPAHNLLEERHAKEALKLLRQCGIEPTCMPVWLAENKAVDLGISGQADQTQLMVLRNLFQSDRIDVFISPVEGRRKKLLMADMDSTIVAGETLDELADFAGVKDQVAAITESAMQGLYDFQTALKARISLLKNLDDSALDETAKKMSLNPGAEKLVAVMKKGGARCVLVSGGFTYFTERAASLTEFDTHHGNVLDIDKGRLTGKVKEPVLDKYAKVDFLNFHARQLKIKPLHVLSIGDGANDIPMLKAAGLGIGYKPKDIVAREIGNLIIHGDLTAALYAQGYSAQHLS